MKLTRLAVFLVAIGMLAAKPAEASPITVNFAFLSGVTTQASGSFQFDSSLVGANVGYSDLSAFSITVLGVPYDLAFINSGGFGPWYHFDFDTNTNTFQWVSIGGFDTLLAAIKSDFSSGFFIRPLASNPVMTEYATGTRDIPYDTLNVQAAAAVPEPGTLLLLATGLAIVARRGLKKHA